ncbi:unnamed protein product [Caenorhabditis angaria]|uniref:Mitochondrial proton/calcium exchanger protein n=1 Tax=Caenorhabditis angaria TaxID=860376 RepID=A0A9P1N8Q5_9PELO|nr:unnamed protein product [Caenorhabditis angaria]
MSLRHISKSYQIGRHAYRHLMASSRFNPYLATSSSHFCTTSLRYAAADKSKIENTLKMLREDMQKQDEERQLKLMKSDKAVAVVKPPLKDRIIHELKHYYHGFRLLALETRVSSKYMWRVLRGATLTRRERQQLVRTVSDLFRLVPFSFFIIVPFMELALPIFIKLFPNMLPSTFQETSKEEEKLRKQVKLRVEMAKFLQDTIEEIGLERKNHNKDASKSLEFAHFIKKVRNEGGYVSNEELLKFSKLFEDELTLDNLSMGQLRSLCRLMGLNSLGSPEILRFQLNMKIRELKADDKQIAAEGGIDALSSLDLQQACRARGMRAIGVSEERLKEQLVQWLELSLNDKVPPSLLLLSRTLYLPEDVSFTDRLKAIVQNLPDGIAETTRQKLTEIEGGTIDHKARIALIKSIEQAISDEKQVQKKRAEQEKAAAEKLKEQKLASAEAIVDEIKQTVEELAKPIVSAAETVAAKTANVIATATSTAKETAKDIKLDKKDLESIETIIVGGSIPEAKNDILGLKEKVIEHREDLIEIHALDGAFAETKIAKRLRHKLDSMIENVDSMVQKLEDEKRNIQEQLSDPAIEGDADLKKKREVRIQDVIDSLSKLKENDASANQKDGAAEEYAKQKERIEVLLKTIDEDEDGIVDKNLVLEVIELLEKHSEVNLSASQVASLIGTLKKEDEVATLTGDIEKVQAGLYEMPVLPTGPSSAAAFNQQSDREIVAEDIEKEVKKVQNGDVVVEIPDVDSKITSTLSRQEQQRKSDPPM